MEREKGGNTFIPTTWSGKGGCEFDQRKRESRIIFDTSLGGRGYIFDLLTRQGVGGHASE